MADLKLTVEVRMRLFLPRLILRCSRFIGSERATRWAWALATRWSRWRVLGGPWQRFRP